MLRIGSRVLITYKGREIEGHVRMVSENQKSAAFVFDGMLGGYVGMMPVFDHGEGYRDLVEGEPVEVKPL
jgi:hypothetical protein